MIDDKVMMLAWEHGTSRLSGKCLSNTLEGMVETLQIIALITFVSHDFTQSGLANPCVRDRGNHIHDLFAGVLL